MASQVFNFLWLNLDLPAAADPVDGTIREPLPPKYIANVRQAGLDNPATDVILWVDSKRLTEKQLAFLEQTLEEDMPNVYLKDLRSIPAYDKADLYNVPETNKNWRNSGQTSVIWRQVDAAKVLISLQGNYEQSFFADLDHSHLEINSPKVQNMLGKHGLMIGSSDIGYVSVENQLWGFEQRRRPFFESYYVTALQNAYDGYNAWGSLVKKISKELERREGIGLAEIVLPISGDGTSAVQTGHEFRNGYEQGKPSVVDKGELTRVFNARSARPVKRDLDINTTWAPLVHVPAQRNPVVTLFRKLKNAFVNDF